jgi:hypothetical protein
VTKRQQWIAVAIYTGVIVLLAAASLLLNTREDDASIGGGFVLLVLSVMSLPWSVPVYLSEVSHTMWALLTAALALVNLGLIVGIARWIAARRARAGRSAAR